MNDLSFLLLPLNYGKEELDGVLTLFKEEKSKKATNDKINTVAVIGLSNGKITLAYNCQALQPSNSAASSNSFGIVFINCTYKKIDCGRPYVVNISIIPA